MTNSVLLVDDHPVFRKGLRYLLEEEADMFVVGEAGDGQSAIELVKELSPDVIVMDISMPGMDGIEATRHIVSEFPNSKVMVLSIHGEKRFVEDMLQAGAVGYVLKEDAPEELVDGIRTVGWGDVYLSAAITGIVVEQYRKLLAGEPGAGEDAGLSEVTATPLLQTKLHQAQISERAVPRARLLDLLEEGSRRPLSLVCAPAGYGKSTLVSQWLEESDWPGAWLSLDTHDNDLRLFLGYFVAAVQTIFDEDLQATLALLRAPDLPPLPTLVRTLVNELERLPQRFILVLDDYHCIDDPAIHEALAELLLHPPWPLHLVLVSRSDPSLDLLRFRAQNQMSEVRAQALSFTVDETTAFLEQVVGMGIEEGIARALTEKTEGWVTGLQLITLSAHSNSDLADVSRVLPGEQQTLDYLIAEALSHQPRELQAWLLKTSILNRFCASLCEAVCASPAGEEASCVNGVEFIRWLIENNLFVVSLDHRGQWFRYHHLFQELLQSQLDNALEVDEIAALHARVGRWFAENDLIDEAIQYALAAGDVSYAVHLVEQHRYGLMKSEQWQRLGQWLKMLPPETVEKNPMLLITQAYLYEYGGQISEAFAYRDQAEGLLSTLQPESLERKGLEGEIAVLHAEQLLLSGEGDLAVESSERALKLLPPQALHMWSFAIGTQVVAYQMAGDIGGGLKIIDEILNEYAFLPGIAKARMMLFSCITYWMEGDLHGLKQAALRCLKLGEQHALPESIAFGRYFLGTLYYVRNESAETERYLAAVLGDPFTVRPQYLVQSAALLALNYTTQGRDEDASDVVGSVISHTVETNEPAASAVAQAFRVELAHRQGKALEAQRLSEHAVYDLLPPVWFSYVPQLTPVKLLLAQNSPESLRQAQTLLDSLDEFLRKSNRKAIRIDLLALQALVFKSQGEEQAALEKLGESLALAEPGGFIRNFVDLGPNMAHLLRKLAGLGVAQAYIDQILSAFPAVPKPHRQGGLIEPPTERELQVLRLLATELSANEIAEQLVVSVATVRAHTRSVYSKLDVHSRYEAVQQAQILGLI